MLNTANESDALGQERRMYLASARTEHYKQTAGCSVFARKGALLIIYFFVFGCAGSSLLRGLSLVAASEATL